MAEAVLFNYTNWVTMYPEFVSVPEPVAANYFAMAGTFWNNYGQSYATRIQTQDVLMNLLTAHIAALFWKVASQGGPGPADPNGPVGRISSATEGSVSVSTDLGTTPTASEFKAFFQQTKYGLMFLAMIGQYTNMRYVPGSLQSGGLGPRGYPGYGGVFFPGRNGWGPRW